MKAELLERLLDAGFSKDEIIQLARDEPNKQEGAKADEKIDNPGITKPENEDDPGPQDNPGNQDNPGSNDNPGNQDKQEDNPGSAFETRLEGIEKRIGDLIKAVQTSNLKNDSIKTPSDTLEDETDKIMKSIIRPEIERKDDKK